WWISLAEAGGPLGSVHIAPQTWGDGVKIRPYIRMEKLADVADEIRDLIKYDHAVIVGAISILGDNVKRDDPVLGYQPQVHWFTNKSMEALGHYIETFAGIREGDGTLLDNMLIYALTDVGFARIHSLDNMPAMTAGRAGGKVKTGLHIKMDGAASSRLGYTAQRVLGLDVGSWGARSNNTSKEIGEILA
ncbi:MAG: hypothetical protein WCJ30_22980, partial [Deltaproteobacteria bacterium]